jgi:hypothetical protein
VLQPQQNFILLLAEVCAPPLSFLQQEDLKLTHEKLQAAEAEHAAMGEQLTVTKEQLAAEQAAHGNSQEQLAAAREQLERVKAQYISTRDQLEAERARRVVLERTVAELRERLETLQRVRDQQYEAASAEKAQWLEQVAAGQKEQQEAKSALAVLQQEYFEACECWLVAAVCGCGCCQMRRCLEVQLAQQLLLAEAGDTSSASVQRSLRACPADVEYTAIGSMSILVLEWCMRDPRLLIFLAHCFWCKFCLCR